MTSVFVNMCVNLSELTTAKYNPVLDRSPASLQDIKIIFRVYTYKECALNFSLRHFFRNILLSVVYVMKFAYVLGNSPSQNMPMKL